MQSDMRVLRLAADEILIDLEPVAADAVLRHLSLYKVGREVEVTDVSSERALVSVIGPAAAHATGSGPIGAEHAHAELEVGGRAARAIATDLGLDLVIAPEDVEGSQCRSGRVGRGGRESRRRPRSSGSRAAVRASAPR